MTQTSTPPQASETPNVARFLGLALIGPVAAGLIVRATLDSVAPLVSSYVVALAMPAPLIAALLLEPRGWRLLIERVRVELKRPLSVIGLPFVALLTWYALSLLLSALGIGAEGLATSATELVAQIVAQAPSATVGPDDIPPFAALVAFGLVASVIAGLTINGLAAFGEEYGWRQYLWTRLERYGRLGTVGALGIAWGLWHAPLILLAGLNYPDSRLAGVFAMVVFTVAASWPLDEIRRATGGAVAPAIFHGMINGIAGLLVVAVRGDALITPPAGLMGAVAMLGAGVAVRFAAPRLGRSAP